MSAVASYVPGGWVAVSAPGAWLLVALPPEHPIVLRCWELMSDHTQPEDILDTLVSDGIRAMPDFALACATGQRRVIARGAATVQVTDPAGAVRLKVAASPNAVWAEESFDEAVDLLLLTSGTQPATEIELPMASGVTMASSIRIHLHGIRRSPAPASADGTDAEADRPAEPPGGLDPTALDGAAAMSRLSGQVTGRGQPPDEQRERPVGEATAAGPDDSGRSYDFLFGATQRPLPLDDEAMPAADEAAHEGAPSKPAVNGPAAKPDPALTAGWSTVVPPDLAAAEDSPDTEEPFAAKESPGAEQRPDTTGQSGGSRLIDAVPWLAAGSHAGPDPTPRPISQPAAEHGHRRPAARTEPQAAQPVGDDVALTVDRAALLAGTKQPPAGPTVLAGYCPAGHLSPPYAATCRVCRTPMPAGQQGFEIARPPLGVIRLADGGSVTLDRGVLFGRAPETAAEGDERPHLVRLVSPENDVSRNHAQIVIDGWHVYAKDLGSTNGTVVTLPGREPVRLRPDDPQLLEDGAQITLADEVTVTYEVTA